MYAPEHFKIDDPKAITEFVKEHPFATITSSTETFPLASHTPLLIRKEGKKHVLYGHLARANKHTREFKDRTKVLVIFQGAHGYISSYAKDPDEMSLLPTWNYQLVHAQGTLTVMSDDELRSFMHTLTDTLEEDQPKSMDLRNYPEKALSDYLKRIIGFRIDVHRWSSCFRMNQNRSEQTRAHIKQHNADHPDLVKAIDEANSCT